jgi:hypothetical protein
MHNKGYCMHSIDTSSDHLVTCFYMGFNSYKVLNKKRKLGFYTEQATLNNSNYNNPYIPIYINTINKL